MDVDEYASTEPRYSIRPVLQPIDVGRPRHDAADVRGDLARLWTKWFNGKDPGVASWEGIRNVAEAFAIFGLDPSQRIDPTAINAKAKELTVEIATVLRALDVAGHLRDHQTSYMMRLILKKLEATQRLMVGVTQLFVAESMQPSDLPPDNFGLWRFVPDNPDGSEPNPGQRARMYALRDLMYQGFRRYRGNIVKRIVTPSPESLPTCAWETVCTIEEYTKSLTGRRLQDPQLWLWLTNGAGYQSVKQLTEWLTECDDPEAPFIVPDRHIFSFRNGVYLAKDEIFIPYDLAHQYFPRDGYPTACKHFDMVFEPQDVTTEDPYRIPTPGIETIFDTQKFSHSVRRWIYCLMGRLLYDVREMDDWQVLPFFKGVANTGKSLVLNYVREFYEDHDVGIISNIIEKQFGLSQIAGKFLGIGDDLRKNFQLDQTEFQNAVSGNGVSCAVKFKGTRLEKPWRTPMAWSGNEVPGFHDNSGSYGRRIAAILFAIIVEHPDGALFDKMMDEMPRFICKCNRIYRNMLRRHENRGIWEILPQEFQQQRQELAACSNALAGFLNSNLVRRGPEDDLFMSTEALRDAVLGFAVKSGMDKPQWGPDYYRGPIVAAGLRIGPDRERKKYPRHGDRIIKGPFVYGIDLEINCEIGERNGQEAFAAATAGLQQQQPAPPQKRARLAFGDVS